MDVVERCEVCVEQCWDMTTQTVGKVWNGVKWTADKVTLIALAVAVTGVFMGAANYFGYIDARALLAKSAITAKVLPYVETPAQMIGVPLAASAALFLARHIGREIFG